MKKLLCAALALCLLAPAACIAEGLGLAEPLTGERFLPEGATAETAAYRLRYEYPQFAAQTEADERVNAFYRALAQDLNSANVGEAELGEGAAYTEITSDVRRNDERYVSVVTSARAMLGNAESETISAQTFARDGLYAGQPLTLSQVLGLERQDDGADSLAEELAYGLVWEIVRRASENADAGYLDGLTEERVRQTFTPESDYYLDGDGNVVFFIQPGEIAGEVAGVLVFPFAPAELLSALGAE